MAWPKTPLTTYIAHSFPSVKALDLNLIQTAINDILNNHHHVGTGDNAPKIDGSTEWLPTAAVNNNNQRLTNVAASAGPTDCVVGGQLIGFFSGITGYLKLPTTTGVFTAQWTFGTVGADIPGSSTADVTFTWPVSFFSSTSYMSFAGFMDAVGGSLTGNYGTVARQTQTASNVTVGVYNVNGGAGAVIPAGTRLYALGVGLGT